MSFSTFETEVIVRPDDIDMNQHVHNTRYLDYVLTARYDQMERCYRMPMADFIERGYSWYVKTTHIEHKRQLVLGDTAIVQTAISEIGGKGCKIEFAIRRKENNKLVADGWIAYTMVSLKSGRATEIPEDVVAAYSV